MLGCSVQHKLFEVNKQQEQHQIVENLTLTSVSQSLFSWVLH